MANKKIKTEASIKGDQPFKTALVECCLMIEADCEPCPATMFLGAQNFRKTTMTSSEKRAETISTKLVSPKLDQANCMTAKEPPLTIKAGMTSRVFFQSKQVSIMYSGRMNAKGGRILPNTAFNAGSGGPVTA